MKVFVDTSALYALLDSSDQFHTDAARLLQSLAQQSAELITTNYVLVETTALLQSRLGIQAVEDFLLNIKPLLTVLWVDEQTHHSAENLLLTMRRRRVSFVDCISFVVMREQSVNIAFANDQHFVEAGFTLLQL
ncbi:MAG: PIN domain-containing protein [Fimbriimonadales bacterium]|nr:PIN domain-containing protein [Fimbriimonadales bacterium]